MLSVLLLLVLSTLTAEQDRPTSAPAVRSGQDILLIVRGDDIGSSHAANLACIRTYTHGIVRTVEVMVPAPWFSEAVRLLNSHPELDVGVHLTLTSEWELCKWGPLTCAPTLVDADGHFFPMTSQRPDFPPNTGFLQAKPVLEQVENELRAQIETARKKIPRISHLTCHMGTATATPQLRTIVEKLSREYRLPLELPGVKRLRWSKGEDADASQMENNLAEALESLEPGMWLLVDHPGLDTAEMRALGHVGYEDVAADRAGVTRAFTSEKVKAVARGRGIKLVTYRQALGHGTGR